ncbi:DNA adenine methylase [Mycoplasmopsis caviae]|uniref:site-specific DNA-methyltransferase (adenine-specific) n=1 Tax=Mycoplasmopsis caviae TaxID=55603 RepID=A0A3P8KWZ1_9BACT|nr:DNA adenine methylase [Mycoplasmopsis caviae]UUD35168.1 DNA adenine methylase [Mycoplasmopsis caviae]VDR42027.1 Adenine-specific DNA methylase [Mycoplasmopsis caviae]
MNKFPTVNYIGNKHKIADWIVDKMPIKGGTVLDLFSGGCSVSYAFKKANYSVISNDVLFSNFVLAKSIIENNFVQLNKSTYEINISVKEIEDKKKEFQFLSNKVYYSYEVDELANLVLISKKIKNEYEKFIFLALLRRAMIRKIPYSRMNVKWEEIQKFRDEEYSYKKYKRYRHYHNIKFIDHINLNLNEYNSAVFNANKECIALNKDALECVKEIAKVDIVYMDPPYPSTMNNYSDFYGPYDLLFQKDLNKCLDLTNKKTFLENFGSIIYEVAKKTKYIAISLNNKSFPSCESMVELLNTFSSEIKIHTKKHTYKVTGKKNKNSNYEILIVAKMKGVE